ncbi:hypothetical protein H4Q26_003941 [Puccinia striiformis f. sp. tritici PST-130]|nr:hypothetical protein H4Q26_003941 [Puccinia striiformis f. sp. tritici PST-130]
MKSIVSKRQAEVTRARADASKVKVAYMKELREHGLTLEEIELKAAAEFLLWPTWTTTRVMSPISTLISERYRTSRSFLFFVAYSWPICTFYFD